VLINARFLFYFIFKEAILDVDEKLQYFQLPYIPCRMVSSNKTKLCLKYFYYIDKIEKKLTKICL
jgi:hypothetical protein